MIRNRSITVPGAKRTFEVVTTHGIDAPAEAVYGVFGEEVNRVTAYLARGAAPARTP